MKFKAILNGGREEEQINGPPHQRADGTYVTDSGAVALYPEQYEEWPNKEGMKMDAQLKQEMYEEAESFYDHEQENNTEPKCHCDISLGHKPDCAWKQWKDQQ